MSKINKNDAPTINGKVNIKAIHEELGFGDISATSGLESILDLDRDLQQELKDFDLECRFISFKDYKSKGFHSKEWRPYKRKSVPKGGAVYTIDSEGYTVKGDLILAVKPREMAENHRRLLKQKADRQNSFSEATEAFKSSVKGARHKVVEGFEDDGE